MLSKKEVKRKKIKLGNKEEKILLAKRSCMKKRKNNKIYIESYLLEKYIHMLVEYQRIL